MVLKNRFVIGVIVGLFLIMSIVVVSADYTLLCLRDGEKVEFSKCNPLMGNRYCHSDITCNYCVYRNSAGTAWCPANLNQCNAIGMGCTYLGGGSGGGGGIIDATPPEISACSPVNDRVYNSRRQNLKCSSDEIATWYYKDLNDRKPKWKRICREKFGCDKKISFDEGENHIIIKAVDEQGNSVEVERTFRVDSKKPKISKTYPKKGFANGVFEIEFKELNPKSLILHYGSQTQEVDLSTCTTDRRDKTRCSVEVDVTSYDGQRIYYWFVLTDVADTVAKYKRVGLYVDTSDPVLLNPDSFWSQRAEPGERNSKYIDFNLKIDERNLDEVSYMDLDARRPKWKRMCSRLRGGDCQKKVRFKKGAHRVDIQITDEAGNAVSAGRIEFDVDY